MQCMIEGNASIDYNIPSGKTAVCCHIDRAEARAKAMSVITARGVVWVW